MSPNCFKLFISFMILKNIATDTSLRNVTQMKEIMLADIVSAFIGVSNINGNMLRNKIIPDMFNLTRTHKFVFKIPDMKSETGFAVISTDRSNLICPIFPNLTISAELVAFKKQRLQSTARNSEGSRKCQESYTNANVWNSLGLDGWSGDITSATDLLEFAHKDRQSVQAQKTSFTNSTTTQILEDFNFSRTGVNLSEIDLSDNIYIARVNDPFGLSTKWAYRNQSNNETVENVVEDMRKKRDIVELYSMLKCATGCEPLRYQSYGCFCGFLGNGVAVDGIDNCCRMHDKCYEQSNCISYLQYFVPYVWKCYRGKPLCALDHGEYGGPTSCAALLCYCDMRLSICLRKYKCPLRKAVCNTSIARKIQNLFF